MKVVNTRSQYGHRGPYEVESVDAFVEEMMPCFRAWVVLEEDFAASQHEATGECFLPDGTPLLLMVDSVWTSNFGDYPNFAEWRMQYHIDTFKSGLEIVDG